MDLENKVAISKRSRARRHVHTQVQRRGQFPILVL